MEVFALVVRQKTLRAVLTVEGKEQLILQLALVRKIAFQHGTTEEEIYMRRPPSSQHAFGIVLYMQRL